MDGNYYYGQSSWLLNVGSHYIFEFSGINFMNRIYINSIKPSLNAA